jgi:hypothetical protein
MPMDWTQVLIAIITLCGTIIVTLFPVMVTAFVNMNTAKLTQVKALADNNQDIANGIVAVIQNTYRTYTNSEKYQAALGKLDERLHLPSGQLQQLVEQAVSIMTLTWGEEWAKLGDPTPTVPQETVVPSVVLVVPSVVEPSV